MREIFLEEKDKETINNCLKGVEGVKSVKEDLELLRENVKSKKRKINEINTEYNKKILEKERLNEVLSRLCVEARAYDDRSELERLKLRNIEALEQKVRKEEMET